VENSPKDCFVNIRVTEQQKARLVKEAIANKLTVSKLANRLFDKHFEPKEIKIAPKPTLPVTEQKPVDFNQLVIVGSIVSGVILIWIFFTNRPRKNEFERMHHNV
jgi:hypothetical protein